MWCDQAKDYILVHAIVAGFSCPVYGLVLGLALLSSLRFFCSRRVLRAMPDLGVQEGTSTARTRTDCAVGVS